MLRLFLKPRRILHLRRISSSTPPPPPPPQPEIPTEYPNNVKNSQHIPPLSSPILPQPNLISPILSSSSLSNKTPLLLLSATLISSVLAFTALSDETLENSVEKSKDSVKKILNQMKQTGTAATVLLKSLKSVLSSANQEVRSGFELRVASLLADIVAANESRRLAIVSAGGGAVVDWLLETVAVSSRDHCATQAEAARALAYLIADPNVCEAVLGRPNAVSNLLRFIFSYQPKKKKQVRSSFDVSNTFKGRSMLVAAIMDIVTSNCDSLDRALFQPSLPPHADMRDIAAAIEVIEEGGMHLDEVQGDDGDDDGGKGMRGIGIKILEGTSVLGLSRVNALLDLEHSEPDIIPTKHAPRIVLLRKTYDSSQAQKNLASITVPGLWDDLQSQHVAVPFAAWALANWASASDMNRSHILELDRDGYAVMAALQAPERTVKWHGSLVARLLLEDHDLPLIDSVPDWSSSLLSTVSHASRTEDIPLAQMALSAFLVSVERSPGARKAVMEKGLHLMRDVAEQTGKHRHVQEVLAKVLELMCTRDVHLSLEESQKWSGILLPWVCGKTSSEPMRFSATNILSCILEDFGPSSIPISQGWLAILLTEILSSNKAALSKGNAQLKTDKVKTQIDQSNALSAAQISNQLASAVVNLAGHQSLRDKNSADKLALADLLSLDPFAGLFKSLKIDNLPKFDAADSALATLKGIKALTELCTEDSVCQTKIVDLGVLCLLRRFLLQDDYEQLAANEAYDASRVLETQEHVSNAPGEASSSGSNDSSSVRVPPTAHIRKHAARLLNILSLLPKVQKAIIADEIWCRWLDECANGRIPGCNDLKIQSYAKSTLLNVFCSEDSSPDNIPGEGMENEKRKCPRYDDMIFLINPELPHWKCPDKTDSGAAPHNSPPGDVSNSGINSSSYDNESVDRESRSIGGYADIGNLSLSANVSEKSSQSEDPLLDIVFIHGLRGGPFKTWRLSEDKSSTTSKSGLVENIDQEAGKQGTCWPREWLATDFPYARLFSVKYKTNLTQWSGASLPLQEVSSMLLRKLVAAGIGDRPVVFVTHSMGGLVVKQMLYEARTSNIDALVKNTVGVVFYSCPHFGSKLADMPWRMGLVFRPAPTIGELRKGSPRLLELNDFIRHLHKKGSLEVLSFSETMVTPIVEGYGGWAFRMEIVPIESAYPGFGELVVLDSTDHINSCKPVSSTDPSYTETLEFLRKLKAHYT